MKPEIVIKRLFQHDHHFEVDSMGYELYSYILSLTKLFRIKTRLKILILNPIVGKQERFFVIKLYHLFSDLTFVHKSNQILNINFGD